MNAISRLDVAAVVPVFNPEPALPGLVRALRRDFAVVLVVDDGSVRDLARFSELPDGVELVRHETNRGKGAAIRTAVELLSRRHGDVAGAVFVDGDGQHHPDDVRAVAAKMLETGAVAFGVRTGLYAADVPLRSRFGNGWTALFARLFLGIRLSDTQTGLRAVPARLFGRLSGLQGDRYEYETRMLGLFSDGRERLEQVPIKTIYIERNRTSHYRPLADTVRTQHVLFDLAFGRLARFSLSGLVGFAADNLVFTAVLLSLEGHMSVRSRVICISLAVARLASAMLNYCCNRWFVFGAAGGGARSCARYWVLALALAFASWLGTSSVSWLLGCGGVRITLAKIVVEAVLFLVSYRVQARWVFHIDSTADAPKKRKQ